MNGVDKPRAHAQISRSYGHRFRSRESYDNIIAQADRINVSSFDLFWGRSNLKNDFQNILLSPIT